MSQTSFVVLMETNATRKPYKPRWASPSLSDRYDMSTERKRFKEVECSVDRDSWSTTWTIKLGDSSYDVCEARKAQNGDLLGRDLEEGTTAHLTCTSSEFPKKENGIRRACVASATLNDVLVEKKAKPEQQTLILFGNEQFSDPLHFTYRLSDEEDVRLVEEKARGESEPAPMLLSLTRDQFLVEEYEELATKLEETGQHEEAKHVRTSSKQIQEKFQDSPQGIPFADLKTNWMTPAQVRKQITRLREGTTPLQELRSLLGRYYFDGASGAGVEDDILQAIKDLKLPSRVVFPFIEPHPLVLSVTKRWDDVFGYLTTNHTFSRKVLVSAALAAVNTGRVQILQELLSINERGIKIEDDDVVNLLNEATSAEVQDVLAEKVAAIPNLAFWVPYWAALRDIPRLFDVSSGTLPLPPAITYAPIESMLSARDQRLTTAYKDDAAGAWLVVTLHANATNMLQKLLPHRQVISWLSNSNPEVLGSLLVLAAEKVTPETYATLLDAMGRKEYPEMDIFASNLSAVKYEGSQLLDVMIAKGFVVQTDRLELMKEALKHNNEDATLALLNISEDIEIQQKVRIFEESVRRDLSKVVAQMLKQNSVAKDSFGDGVLLAIMSGSYKSLQVLVKVLVTTDGTETPFLQFTKDAPSFILSAMEHLRADSPNTLAVFQLLRSAHTDDSWKQLVKSNREVLIHAVRSDYPTVLRDVLAAWEEKRIPTELIQKAATYGRLNALPMLLAHEPKMEPNDARQLLRDSLHSPEVVSIVLDGFSDQVSVRSIGNDAWTFLVDTISSRQGQKVVEVLLKHAHNMSQETFPEEWLLQLLRNLHKVPARLATRSPTRPPTRPRTQLLQRMLDIHPGLFASVLKLTEAPYWWVHLLDTLDLDLRKTALLQEGVLAALAPQSDHFLLIAVKVTELLRMPVDELAGFGLNRHELAGIHNSKQALTLTERLFPDENFLAWRRAAEKGSIFTELRGSGEFELQSDCTFITLLIRWNDPRVNTSNEEGDKRAVTIVDENNVPIRSFSYPDIGGEVRCEDRARFIKYDGVHAIGVHVMSVPRSDPPEQRMYLGETLIETAALAGHPALLSALPYITPERLRLGALSLTDPRSMDRSMLESRLAQIARDLSWGDTKLDKLMELFAVVECCALMEYFTYPAFLQPRPYIRLADLDLLDGLADAVWRNKFRDIWSVATEFDLRTMTLRRLQEEPSDAPSPADDVVLAKSTILGVDYGILAKKIFHKNDFIMYFQGVGLKDTVYAKWNPKPEWVGRYAIKDTIEGTLYYVVPATIFPEKDADVAKVKQAVAYLNALPADIKARGEERWLEGKSTLGHFVNEPPEGMQPNAYFGKATLLLEEDAELPRPHPPMVKSMTIEIYASRKIDKDEEIMLCYSDENDIPRDYTTACAPGEPVSKDPKGPPGSIGNPIMVE